MKPEDHLMDALLTEQARGREADEAFLQEVDQRLAQARRKPALWKRAVPLSAAAALAMGGAWLAFRDEVPTVQRERAVTVHYGSTQGNQTPAVEGRFFEQRLQALPTDRSLDAGLAAPALEESAVVDAFAPRAAPEILARSRGQTFQRDRYARLQDVPWASPLREPLSTFSVDVDTASYANVRRMILDSADVPPDAVRIEEMINAFDYSDAPPVDGSAFARHVRLATCPWNENHLLARVTLKGREVSLENRPPANLVFLIDVSGSMSGADKLPLLKTALAKLIESLDERDRLAIAVYAGTEGLVLPSTRLDSAGKDEALAALQRLESGGSTNGGAGIDLAYRLAAERADEDGIHRVILATDGDFNVGVTGEGELVEKVKAEARKGIGLSVLAFGRGNLNDSMLEAISNDGDGNYFYLDSPAEADRVLRQKLTGTLVTIAKDVKIQVEFNPAKVGAYRLIGYANRQLRDEDFNNDRVDAGDIGAGHTVTAFYEIAPAGGELPDVGELDPLRYQGSARAAVAGDGWFTLKLRFKQPEGGASQLLETEVKGEATPWTKAGRDFRLGASVAAFGMKLRQMPEFADVPWSGIGRIGGPVLEEESEAVGEFRELLDRLAGKETRR